MASRTQRKGRTSAPAPGIAEDLYVQFLDAFYEHDDREKALKLVPKLEATIAAKPKYAGSIRSEEVRSLIAELNGDYAEAARCREAEIRKILELHTLAANTSSWDTVARQYDHADVSDRLDLLALLYDRQGDTERAIAVLEESRQYCQSHEIPFDGTDLLTELTGTRTGSGKRAQGPRPSTTRGRSRAKVR
jgi:hypothetical protein